MKWFLICLRKYVDFTGRARPKEFWNFILFSLLIGMLIGTVDRMFSDNPNWVVDGPGPVFWMFSLFVMIPGYIAAIRRLHDIDRSGIWLLLLAVPLVGWLILVLWLARPGTPGENRFGPDPLVEQPLAPVRTPTVS